MALLTEEQRTLGTALGGSKAVWTGRPLPGLRLRSGDGMQIFGLIFVGAFFIFWETLAAQAPPLFRLFGVVVFALIFYQSFGPLTWAWLTRSRTYYALTEDRFAILYTAVFSGFTKRIYLPALDTIDLQMASDGSGSIVFGAVHAPPWWMRGRGWNPAPRLPAFEGIADASAVYDMCTRLQSGTK